MKPDELVETWKREQQQPFSGWDFSHLDGRMIEEQPPWSYSRRAAELMRQSASVIDMGTGGAERLLKLLEHWPGKVVATEEYPPNLRLATQRLAPFGVKVVDVRLKRDEVVRCVQLLNPKAKLFLHADDTESEDKTGAKKFYEFKQFE